MSYEGTDAILDLYFADGGNVDSTFFTDTTSLSSSLKRIPAGPARRSQLSILGTPVLDKKIEIAETTYYCNGKSYATQARADRPGHGRQTWRVI